MTLPGTSPTGAGVIADIVASAALAVPGVTRLHTGSFGEVATYLPGRRVDGVRLRPGSTEVHLVLRPDVDLLRTAERVRTAVNVVVGGTVDVFVEDLGVAAVPRDPHAPADAAGP